ncbi:MAG: MarR family transcriptional regulator [Oscillospiraceae bacterium]|jgi:DNA-binding MarR family transcriptional regulator|nr:MarR family transcriptional regulator [Oscillospiraceae bacterium]
MDYTALAVDLLDKMQSLRKVEPHKHINEALHGEMFVLLYIAFRGGDVLPGEISHEMEVSSARVAAALNGLEGKGLITRRTDSSDRRKVLVGVTEEGRDFAEKQYRAMLEKAAELLSMLGERDAVEYVRITGRLAENILTQGETPPCCN